MELYFTTILLSSAKRRRDPSLGPTSGRGPLSGERIPTALGRACPTYKLNDGGDPYNRGDVTPQDTDIDGLKMAALIK